MPEKVQPLPSRKFTVRFAVGEPDGPRGCVWRVWSNKNDVYISAWALTNVQKISLHQSGHWRNAFTSEFAAKDTPLLSPGQDRATDKWYRPDDFVPGLTKAFEIVVPASEVTVPTRPEANVFGAKEIAWVQPPPEGYATHFTVLFTSPEVTDTTLPGWPGRNAMGTRHIAHAALPNGQTVWVVAHEQAMSEWLQETVAAFKRTALAEMKRELGEATYSEIKEPRAYIYGQNNNDGSRYYIDVSGVDLQKPS
jgi:hypothetical protein